MPTDDDRIFVRIAAYREFDLVPTLRDCLARADDPDRLRICICWQHAPHESLAELTDDPRLDVIAVDYRESRGMCWARNLIQDRWDGEPYTLGLDGHHRFVPGWDSSLVELLRDRQRAGSAKPIITAYAPSFDPADDIAARADDVWFTGFDRFDPRGIVFMRPFVAETQPSESVPTRFWSGHFNFTLGRWNEEVPVDPDAYFHSEEIVMTVRSFTSGYDLFNPPCTVLWHEYTRRNRVCHWDDHDNWEEHTAATVDTYRHLFGVDGEPPLTDYPYGFGSDRTLTDYERFAGLDFARRGVQQYTIDNGIPPDPGGPNGEWDASLAIGRNLDLVVPRRVLDQGCDFCGVFVNAADGTELHRGDIGSPELQALLAARPDPLVTLHLDFPSTEPPATWTVRPHHPRAGWLEAVTEGCDERPAPREG